MAQHALQQHAWLGLRYCVARCFRLGKKRAVYAEACGCKQPRAFSHIHSACVPFFVWVMCRPWHMPKHVRKLTPMHMAECVWLIAAACIGIDCPFFRLGNVCNCEASWCMGHWRRGVRGHRELAPKSACARAPAPKCACAWGTGAQVCMCSGHCLDPKPPLNPKTLTPKP